VLRERLAAERAGDVLDRPSATVSAGGTAAGGGAEPFANADYRRAIGAALSRVDRPAPVIKENSGRGGRGARASQRPSAEGAAELEAAGLADRPATTVAGDPRLPPAGHHERQQKGAAHLSLADRSTLQGFPDGFVFHGATAGSRDKQCGNAVPPQLAEAVGRSIATALRAAER
jgi:DNA (cytosine-5)-methyltransferase 1